ncbi:acyltransferase [bacterium]|nr:acyltransferase [bacterium]
MKPLKIRKELDGLRGLAALYIVFYHAGFQGFEGALYTLDIFFVLSGYLITRKILEELEISSFSFKTFYIKRIRRIIPLLSAVCIACSAFAWMLLQPNTLKDFAKGIVSTSLFGSNIFFWKTTGYYSPSTDTNPLIHFWSISLEEQFYFFFPIVYVLAFKKIKNYLFPILVLGIIASLGLAELGSYSFPTANYFLLPTRAWEFLTGAVLSTAPILSWAQKLKRHSQALSISAFIILMISILTMNEGTPHPGWRTTIPVISTALIILFAHKGTFINTFLSLTPFAWAGTISYSIYLWHVPFFAFTRVYLAKEPPTYVYLLLIAVLLAFSHVTWKFIEQPFRSFKKFSNRYIIKLYAINTCIIISISIFFLSGDGHANRFTADQNKIFSSEQSASHNYLRKNGRSCTSRKLSDACKIGESKIKPTIALLGDSHGHSLAYSLAKKLKSMNLAGYDFTQSACPPIPGTWTKSNGAQRYCNTNLDPIFSFILESDEIDTVIFASRYAIFYYGTRFNDGKGGVEHGTVFETGSSSGEDTSSWNGKQVLDAYVSTIETLLDANKKVILVNPIPEVGYHVPSYLAKIWSQGQRSLEIPLSLYFERNSVIMDRFKTLSHFENLHQVYPHEVFCNSEKNVCIANKGLTSYYYDSSHPSIEGADLIIEQLSEPLDKGVRP